MTLGTSSRCSIHPQLQYKWPNEADFASSSRGIRNLLVWWRPSRSFEDFAKSHSLKKANHQTKWSMFQWTVNNQRAKRREPTEVVPESFSVIPACRVFTRWSIRFRHLGYALPTNTGPGIIITQSCRYPCRKIRKKRKPTDSWPPYLAMNI